MIDKINEIYAKEKNPVILTFDEDLKYFENKNTISLGSYNNLAEISKNIFSILRNIEKESYSLIIFEGLKEEQLGIALMDRFRKICNNNYIEV